MDKDTRMFRRIVVKLLIAILYRLMHGKPYFDPYKDKAGNYEIGAFMEANDYIDRVTK